MEEWRPVVGYEGRYEVSDQGRIRSLDRVETLRSRWGGTFTRRVRGRMMRLMAHPQSGRPCVGTRGPNKDKSKDYILIHRAVLEAFVGPGEGRYALHWDDDPHHNTLDNLRWGTPSDNAFDRERNKRARLSD